MFDESIMEPVSWSSTIAGIGYDGEYMEMYVRFIKNNSLYVYKNVPEMVYKTVRDAPSVGGALDTFVKKAGYPYDRIE